MQGDNNYSSLTCTAVEMWNTEISAFSAIIESINNFKTISWVISRSICCQFSPFDWRNVARKAKRSRAIYRTGDRKKFWSFQKQINTRKCRLETLRACLDESLKLVAFVVAHIWSLNEREELCSYSEHLHQLTKMSRDGERQLSKCFFRVCVSMRNSVWIYRLLAAIGQQCRKILEIEISEKKPITTCVEACKQIHKVDVEMYINQFRLFLRYNRCPIEA